MTFESVKLDAFLQDIASVHYSDELLSVFQEPLTRALEGVSLHVINKTAYKHTICCVLPAISQAKASPLSLQLILTNTTQNSHALMETLHAIAHKLGITSQELLEPVPGTNVAPLSIKPSILVGSIKAFMAQKQRQPELVQETVTLILDNADAMLNLGYAEDIKLLVKTETIAQILVFTGSENIKIDAILAASSKVIQKVVLEDTAITPDTLTQELYHVNKEEKIPLLLGLLDKLSKAIVVCNTKGTAEYVSKKLSANNIASGLLLSYISRKEQKETIDGFQSGKTQVLVTNDKTLERTVLKSPYIVNYDLPLSPQAYKLRLHHTDTSAAHTAISFACEEYVYNLPIIEQELGFKIPVREFSPSLLKTDRGGHSEQHRRYDTARSNFGNSQRRNHAGGYSKGREHNPEHSRYKDANNNRDRNNPNRQNIERHSNNYSQERHPRPAYHKQEAAETPDAAKLYTMSAEERLKLYQQKYASRYEHKSRKEQDSTDRSKRHIQGNAQGTSSARNKNNPKAYKQPAQNQQKALRQKENKPDQSAIKKPSLIQGILNMFKPKKEKKDRE